MTGGYAVRDPKLPTALRALPVRRTSARASCAASSPAPDARPRDDRPLGLSVASPSSFGEDASGRVYVASLEGPVYRLAAEEGP